MEFNKFTEPPATEEAVPPPYQFNNKKGIIYH